MSSFASFLINRSMLSYHSTLFRRSSHPEPCRRTILPQKCSQKHRRYQYTRSKQGSRSCVAGTLEPASGLFKPAVHSREDSAYGDSFQRIFRVRKERYGQSGRLASKHSMRGRDVHCTQILESIFWRWKKLWVRQSIQIHPKSLTFSLRNFANRTSYCAAR